MPKYKMLTPMEIGHESGLEMAEEISTIHAELVKKGLDAKIIASVVDKVAGAAKSSSDGWCTPARIPGEEVIRTP